jgi:hypothetical protein
MSWAAVAIAFFTGGGVGDFFRWLRSRDSKAVKILQENVAQLRGDVDTMKDELRALRAQLDNARDGEQAALLVLGVAASGPCNCGIPAEFLRKRAADIAARDSARAAPVQPAPPPQKLLVQT